MQSFDFSNSNTSVTSPVCPICFCNLQITVNLAVASVPLSTRAYVRGCIRFRGSSASAAFSFQSPHSQWPHNCPTRHCLPSRGCFLVETCASLVRLRRDGCRLGFLSRVGILGVS